MDTSIIPHNPQNPLQFDFHGHPIRIIMLDAKPYFIAMDACKALNHSNVSKALNGLKDDERAITKGYTEGVIRDLAVVTLSGLLRLIFRSNKEEAEEFRLWVFNEILPQVMQTGNYISPNADLLDVAEQMIASIRQQNQRIAAMEWKQDNQDAAIHQHDTRLTRLEKRPRKDYHTVKDYMFDNGYTETPERLEGFEQRALRMSMDAGYEVQELEGNRMAFHKDVLKRL